jgi:hypothetical protein
VDAREKEKPSGGIIGEMAPEGFCEAGSVIRWYALQAVDG